jgi:hypothetical protein
MEILRYDPESHTPFTDLALANLRLLVGQWATEPEGTSAAIVDHVEQFHADSMAWFRDDAMREGPPQGRPLSRSAAST